MAKLKEADGLLPADMRQCPKMTEAPAGENLTIDEDETLQAYGRRAFLIWR